VILAYYFEPYVVAAFLAAQWTGRPLIVKHAGSDLDRLMRVPDLATTYIEILRSADCLLTTPWLVNRFIGMGVPEERIFQDTYLGLPSQIFSPTGGSLDVAELLGQVRSSARIDSRGEGVFDPDIPTIGIYGKVGFYKGSYDLLAALGILKQEGLSFNLLTMTDGEQMERFVNEIRANGLQQRATLLPFLPHWQVPRFIRTCTAVCFLERDFPIAIHGPLVPREVLACGTCLVLSREVADKQSFRDRLITQENVLIVDDPKDHASLAHTLRNVVLAPDRARDMGREGARISQQLENFEGFVDGLEELLRAAVHEPSAARPITVLGQYRRSGGVEPDLRFTIASVIQEEMPCVAVLLGDRCDAVLREFGQQVAEATDRFVIAASFCDFLQDQLPLSQLPIPHEALEDVLRYQRATIRASQACDGEEVGDATTMMRAQDPTIGDDSLLESKPMQSSSAWIESFGYDVTPLFTHGNLDEADGGGLNRQSTSVLFGTLPNFERYQLKVSEATRQLFALCDGTRDARTIRDLWVKRYDLTGEHDRQAMSEQIVRALRRLGDRGALTFSAPAG
jgi:glycosyltransferase involved in cell wall biosynthesis